MWAYQRTYRILVGLEIEHVLSRIGLPLKTRVLLIGFARDDGLRHQICIEPEESILTVDHLDGVLDRSKELFDADPETDITHSDRGLHERRIAGLVCRSRADALVEAIESSGVFEDLSFFVSGSSPIGDYEVHTCIGVPTAAFDCLPAFDDSVVDRVYVGRSLQHEVIVECLRQADRSLQLPNPGVDLSPLGGTDSIVQAAAIRLTDGAAYRATSSPIDLFSCANSFTSLSYERAGARGNFVIVTSEKAAGALRVRFQQPVSLREARSMRKLLELTDDGMAVLADDKGAYGLGACIAAPDAVQIAVASHGVWELRVDGLTLMRVAYGQATLPGPPLTLDEFTDVAERIVGPIALTPIWGIVQNAQESGIGTMVVVAGEPEEEVARLGAEAVPIDAKLMEPADVIRFSRVDGAILLGPDGRCHAFGVILDGVASGRGDPARGSRFNSAVRYQGSTCKDAIVIVISDDGTVDLIPRLRPRVHKSDVDAAVRAFEFCCKAESVDAEEFVSTHYQVKGFAFYLSDAQCTLVNQCHEKEMVRRFKAGGTRIREAPLRPHPEMNESYFVLGR